MYRKEINVSEERIHELKLKALELRERMVRMIYEAKRGHIGGALSESDIMTALFQEVMLTGPEQLQAPDHDIFILSKGHNCEPYYCSLSDRGYFDDSVLDTFCRFDSLLGGHPSTKIPGVEIATGALGHGLSIACGAALAKKRDQMDSEVYVLMGDGELAEGTNWEAAMFAANHQLDNLYAIVDRNHLQLSGATEEIMKLEDLKKKWEAFGFEVTEIDGNDMAQILHAFKEMKRRNGKPKLLLANTVKGKGISFMENQASWHAGYPNEEQYAQAVKEFAQARKELSGHE